MSTVRRIMSLGILLVSLGPTATVAESQATKLLKARSAEFEQDVIKVSEEYYGCYLT